MATGVCTVLCVLATYGTLLVGWTVLRARRKKKDFVGVGLGESKFGIHYFRRRDLSTNPTSSAKLVKLTDDGLTGKVEMHMSAAACLFVAT